MGTTPHFPGYTAAWCNPKMKHLYKSGSTTVPGIPGYSIQTIPRPRQFQYGWVSPLRCGSCLRRTFRRRNGSGMPCGLGLVGSSPRIAARVMPSWRHLNILLDSAPSPRPRRARRRLSAVGSRPRVARSGFSAESPSASSSSQAERGGLEAERVARSA